MDRLRITTDRTMVLVLMSASFIASPLYASPRVSRLRCEYQKSPLGIDATNPRFAWMIGGQKRGVLQAAYQILVATNLDDLYADVGDMWDSGKVQSNQSSQIVYAGKALTSRTRYYWKVRVWNQSGRLSEYSEPTWWEMGLLQPGDWVGNWIEPEGGVPALSVTDEYETLRLPELSNVSPNLFRKRFEIKKEIKIARAYVTGLGSYLLHLNGSQVGDAKFAPDWTNFKKRIHYQVFDISAMLEQGENVVGVVLGSGLSMGRAFGGVDSRQLLLQLNITYTDGTSEAIVTDTTWKCEIGPRLLDFMFTGEMYDARREVLDWDRPGFNDEQWKAVRIKKNPLTGKLVSHPCEPIKVTEKIPAVKMTEPEEQVYVFDLGQNFSGWARLKVQGPAGTKVRLRFAELLDEKGNLQFANTIGYGCNQTDVYVLKGQGVEVWEPQFVTHGFRYVEVINYPGEPTLDAIEGRAVHSAVPWAGEFSCSSQLINQIQQNVTWGIRSNISSIPTDCCQRAERSGWGGDAQVMADTACLNFGMVRFYSKWLYDFADDQRPDGGVYDNTPWTGWGGFGAPGWHDCYVKIAHTVYRHYGDTRVIRQQYAGMQRSIDFILDVNPHLIWENHVGGNYADWGSPIRDEEHKALLNTCNFYRAVDFMAEMSAVIQRSDEARSYTDLANRIKVALNERFFNSETGQYASGAQAANAFALFLDIVPPAYQARVVENLVRDIQAHDNHLTTGPQGTRYVMQALTDNGHADLAYALATQTTQPSWGYMVLQGATTLWEFWNGSIQISHNHPFLGSVSEWFYKALAGIDAGTEEAGYKQIKIKPHVVGDLSWVKSSVQTIGGNVSVAWKRDDDSFTLTVTIPGNSTAQVHVPKVGWSNVAVSENGKLVWENRKFLPGVAGIISGFENQDRVVFAVGSGSYQFKITDDSK